MELMWLNIPTIVPCDTHYWVGIDPRLRKVYNVAFWVASGQVSVMVLMHLLKLIWDMLPGPLQAL